MTRTGKAVFVGVAVCLALLSAAARAEVGTLFVKNNGDTALHVFVEDVYQGFVKPTETRYIVPEGFVTFQSGKGDNPVEESHGGWESKGEIKVRGQRDFVFEEKKYIVTAMVAVDGGAEKKAYVWFGDGQTAGAPMTDADVENARQIEKGSAKPVRGDYRIEVAKRESGGVLPDEVTGTFVSFDISGMMIGKMIIKKDGRVIGTNEISDDEKTGRVSWCARASILATDSPIRQFEDKPFVYGARKGDVVMESGKRKDVYRLVDGALRGVNADGGVQDARWASPRAKKPSFFEREFDTLWAEHMR